jgi:hypothetical protein
MSPRLRAMLWALSWPTYAALVWFWSACGSSFDGKHLLRNGVVQLRNGSRTLGNVWPFKLFSVAGVDWLAGRSTYLGDKVRAIPGDKPCNTY